MFPDKDQAGDIRWFDVPSTQVKLDHGDKALDRVLNRRHREEGFRMGHKAVKNTCVSRYIQILVGSSKLPAWSRRV